MSVTYQTINGLGSRIFHDCLNGWGHLYRLLTLLHAEQLQALAKSDRYLCYLSPGTPQKHTWLHDVLNNKKVDLLELPKRYSDKLRVIERKNRNLIQSIHPRLETMTSEDVYCYFQFLLMIEGHIPDIYLLNNPAFFYRTIQKHALYNKYLLCGKLANSMPDKLQVYSSFGLDKDARVVALHIRDTSHNPNNRDSTPMYYRKAVTCLLDKGYSVVRIGHGRPIFDNPMPGYSEFCTLWSTYYDFPLIYYSDLYIGCNSGPIAFRGMCTNKPTLLLNIPSENLADVLLYSAFLPGYTYSVRQSADEHDPADLADKVIRWLANDSYRIDTEIGRIQVKPFIPSAYDKYLQSDTYFV